MRVFLSSFATLVLAIGPVLAQDPTPEPAPAAGCSLQSTQDCDASKARLNQARKAFARGNKLKKRHPEQALEAFEEAARLVPRNVDYVTTREVFRQQLIYEHLRSGNHSIFQNERERAASDFRAALRLDPENQYAAERLREVTSAIDASLSKFIESAPEEGKLRLNPKPVRSSFHLTSDARGIISAIANAFGIKVEYDPSVPARSVRFNLENVDFFQAIDIACTLTHTFWMPLSPTDIMVAADTPAAHRELDRYLLRSFYLPDVMSAQELNDITNLLRTVFEIRFIAQQPASSTITVRAPADIVNAATRLLENMSSGRPQVMIDFQSFEISRQMLQAMGINLPLQFTAFNIPSSALSALSSNQNIQDLINQLIASGGINQANNSAISALIAQLQNQQSALFQNPLATFGGGKTLFGVGIPPATVNFSRNESHVTTLEHVTMRAAQGNAATFRLGQRYPILNAIYAPVFNTPQVANILGNNSYVAPFPSFNYEDLGVTLKAKPLIHGATDVTLDLEMDIRSLGASSVNGIPIINQRSYKGVISVKDGEAAVIAGSVSTSELKTLTGIPGMVHVPALNYLTSNRNRQLDQSELLIVITPHIVSAGFTGATPAVVLPPASR
jgi:general secretion pathway protein D